MNAQTLATWTQYAGLTLTMAGGAPWPHPNWIVVGVGLAIVGVGIAWKRAADKRDPRLAEGGTHGAHGDAAPVREGTVPAARVALPNMVSRAKALLERVETDDLVAIATEIDSMQQQGTEQVAASQEAIVRAHSFAQYATVMTPLATAERWLYRAWSAASDGHRPEVIASLKSALPYLEEAESALGKL